MIIHKRLNKSLFGLLLNISVFDCISNKIPMLRSTLVAPLNVKMSPIVKSYLVLNMKKTMDLLNVSNILHNFTNMLKPKPRQRK